MNLQGIRAALITAFGLSGYCRDIERQRESVTMLREASASVRTALPPVELVLEATDEAAEFQFHA